MKKKVLVLPGDGVGSELCDAALRILEQFKLPVECTHSDIGWECWKQEANSVPQETW
nr:isocitrate/isopropylmalate family dehydrogenase [Bartonella senegalensis]